MFLFNTNNNTLVSSDIITMCHTKWLTQIYGKVDVVSMYEWALGDNVGIHTDWNIIENVTTVDNKHVCFFYKDET
jgi:hypothetical protein